MELIAYSDGSHYDDRIGSSAIILTKTTFVDMRVHNGNGRGPLEAEMVAFFSIFDMIEERDLQFSKLVIFVDYKTIIKYFNKCKKEKEVPIGYRYVSQWEKVLKVINSKMVTVEHHKAHLGHHTVNKTCDILARSVRKCTP